MSRGDRYAYAALGLVVGVGLTLLLVALPYILPNDSSKNAGDDPLNHQVLEKQHAGSGDRRFWLEWYKSYFVSGDSMAEWVTASISGVATAISLLAVLYVKDSLDLNRQAIKLTREIGQAQVRAYLSGVLVEIIPRVSERSTVFRLTVLNSGQSPARDITVFGEVDFTIGNQHFFERREFHLAEIGGGQSYTVERGFPDLTNCVDKLNGLMLISENLPVGWAKANMTYRDIFEGTELLQVEMDFRFYQDKRDGKLRAGPEYRA